MTFDMNLGSGAFNLAIRCSACWPTFAEWREGVGKGNRFPGASANNSFSAPQGGGDAEDRRALSRERLKTFIVLRCPWLKYPSHG